MDKPLARPDITLTLDREGVIKEVVSSDDLAGEHLDKWLGRSFADTIHPATTRTFQTLIGDVKGIGAPSFVKVMQRLPSGREVPMEYTTVSLGAQSGFVAIGKNLQVLSDLQSRLMQSQQERERDHWKLREIETRYRMLFDASTEASVLVLVGSLQIIEANAAAVRGLSLLPGSVFLPELRQQDRRSLETMLEKVRAQGRAPGIAVHLPPQDAVYSLRASLMTSDSGVYYLIQIAPIGHDPAAADPKNTVNVNDIIQRLPDGLAIIDKTGVIRQVNPAFLDLADLGSEAAAVGQNVRRWLSEPGADAGVVIGLVQKHGSVRRLETVLHGELGESLRVEVTAAGNKPTAPDYIGILVSDLTKRAPASADDGDVSPAIASTTSDAAASPDASLETLVRSSTEAIERAAILAALEEAGGNKTAAARKLGLSRQSLHAKLKKYSLE